VAYNDAMRILLKRPRWTSANEMFVAAGVKTFKAVLRNLMYKFICRVDDSENEIIMFLLNIKFSTPRYQSQLWRHWYSCLFIKHVFFVCFLLVILCVFYYILMFCTIWTLSL